MVSGGKPLHLTSIAGRADCGHVVGGSSNLHLIGTYLSSFLRSSYQQQGHGYHTDTVTILDRGFISVTTLSPGY